MKFFKTKHPQFGHVLWKDPSPREYDILKIYERIEQLKNEFGNDAKLGGEVRKLFK